MKTIKISAIIGAVALSASFISCDKQCKLCYTGVPSQIISVAQANEMKSEYQNNIAPLIENAQSAKSGVKYDATEYAYIELDSLKKYVAFLDEVSRLNNKKLTGLRIYFAAYPNQTNLGYKLKNPGRETFFMVPTADFSNQFPVNAVQKQYKTLQNLPVSIKPKNAKVNKYIGEFSVMKNLLFKHDLQPNVPQQNTTAAKLTTDPEQTSLVMNDLYIIPPPKK